MYKRRTIFVVGYAIDITSLIYCDVTSLIYCDVTIFSCDLILCHRTVTASRYHVHLYNTFIKINLVIVQHVY